MQEARAHRTRRPDEFRHGAHYRRAARPPWSSPVRWDPVQLALERSRRFKYALQEGFSTFTPSTSWPSVAIAAASRQSSRASTVSKDAYAADNPATLPLWLVSDS